MEYGPEYTDYQANRSWVRKFVRRLYLASARARLMGGPTLDFGCGIGELLQTLPPGSRGLEYNRATVALCKASGLKVDWYDGFADDWRLSVLPEKERFESMVLSHVLEHFDSPMQILERMLEAAQVRDIQRVLIIVPGRAGFAKDPTHRTFVDLQMLERALSVNKQWRLSEHFYFPFPLHSVGGLFVHNELQVVLDRI